ncbi:hypothetical protein HDV04_002232 [Boothiomyces sp. JEL0838]|nr:hypothetical protein HDV04_002232 [Boothiomyces sp. JEL0838]
MTSLEQLPLEILLSILLFVPDTDLRTMTLVSKKFRTLATDPILWKMIFTERNLNQVSFLLSKADRPDRLDLVRRNILRSSSSITSLTNDINTGSYYSGPFGVTSYQISVLLKQLQQKRVLTRHLQKRPTIEDLSQRNLVTSSSIAPSLHAQILTLTKEFKRMRLAAQMSKRKSVNQLPKNIAGSAQSFISKNLYPVYGIMERKLLKRQLRNGLVERSDISIIDSRKLIRNEPYLASLICPSIRPKIKYYEALTFEL